MIVGCNAAGVNVEDLEVATVPVTRFQVRSGRSLGGITVRLFEQDTQSVMIRFFDQDGIDIAEPGATQDRAAVPPRGVPPRPGVRDRRHRVCARGLWSSTPRR